MDNKTVKTKEKRHRGDRRDGYLVRDSDSMHRFISFILPNRTDNEAVMTELVDMTEVDAYLGKKALTDPEFKYTMFHVICAALAKVLYLRPKMNYFFAGNRLYARKEISFSFVVKRQFDDFSEEALAIVRIDDKSAEPPIEQIHSKVKKFVMKVRGESKSDGTTDIISVLVKFPRPIVRFIVRILNSLEYHGKLPKDLEEFDPYHSSVFISNTGSIKLSAQYHHLTNWGTNSLFVLVGEKKPTPFFDENGTVTMKQALELSITVDERISDGTYYSRSIKLLRYLLAHPELLEQPIDTPVDF